MEKNLKVVREKINLSTKSESEDKGGKRTSEQQQHQGVVEGSKADVITNHAEILSDSGSFDSGSFDYVLVDAECSHEGSIKHITKYASQWGLETMNKRMVWLEQTEELRKLQLGLLRNGFRNLKKGGVLIYSTCSFCRSQNEDLVEEFLKEKAAGGKGCGKNTDEDEAELVSLFERKRDEDDLPLPPCVFSDDLKSMARFDPVISQTSGLFMAKIRKKGVGEETMRNAKTTQGGG